MKKILLLISLVLIYSGMFLSTLPAQWVKLNIMPERPYGPSVESLTANEGNIYAGSDSNHIFRSTDDGLTWSEIDSGFTGLRTTALAAKGDTIISGAPFGIFVSTNRGKSWVHTARLHSIHTLVFHSDGLYAGTDDGVYRSNDFGMTWDTLFTSYDIPAIAFNGSTLFAGNFFSIDNGKSWVEYNIPEKIYSLTVIDTVIFAGTYSTVYTSSDNGLHWAPSGKGFSQTSFFQEFEVSGNNIFVGTNEGLYLSTNMGAHWSNIDANVLSQWNIVSLAIHNGKIFTGSHSGGRMRIVSEILSSSVKTSPPDYNSFAQLSPNPTTGKISVHNAPENIQRITIMNVLGEKVLELPHPNTPEFTLDLSELSAGTYFARFSLANEVITRKIMKE